MNECESASQVQALLWALAALGIGLLAIAAVGSLLWKFAEVVRFLRRHRLSFEERKDESTGKPETEAGPRRAPLWLTWLLVVIVVLAIVLPTTILLTG